MNFVEIIFRDFLNFLFLFIATYIYVENNIAMESQKNNFVSLIDGKHVYEVFDHMILSVHWTVAETKYGPRGAKVIILHVVFCLIEQAFLC